MGYPAATFWTLPARPRLAQATVDPDDIRGLQRMDPDDLAVLGRLLSAGRIVASSKQASLLFDAVDAFSRAFSSVGLAMPSGLGEADRDAKEWASKRAEFQRRAPSVDAGMAAIARAMTAKRPDWDVSYTDSTGAVIIVAAPGAPAKIKQVNIDAPDPTLAGALRYVHDNADVAERLTKAAALGSPGILLLILAIIVVLALLAYGIVALLSSDKKAWEEELMKRKAANEAANQRDLARVSEISAKGAQATPEEMAERTRLAFEIQKKAAENAEIDKALEKSREMGGVVGEIVYALGLRPVAQWIFAGAGIILLTGLAVWVLGSRQAPQPPPPPPSGRRELMVLP